jgi:hypothetical protein
VFWSQGLDEDVKAALTARINQMLSVLESLYSISESEEDEYEDVWLSLDQLIDIDRRYSIARLSGDSRRHITVNVQRNDACLDEARLGPPRQARAISPTVCLQSCVAIIWIDFRRAAKILVQVHSYDPPRC